MKPTPETCLTGDILAELILHRSAVQAEDRVGEVFDRINAQPEEFCGVVEAGRFVGLIAKAQLGLLLSGRFGYSLYARQAVRLHRLKDPVMVTPGEPLLGVLERALSRSGMAFHHDLAVVGEDGAFLGILPMPALVRLQNELVAEQTRRAEEQRHALQHQELQLFRSQQRLRQSEGRFGILFENGPLGFALLATDGRIEACNGRLARLLGLLPGEELPSFGACLALRQREKFERILRGFEENVEGEEMHTLELRFEKSGAEPRLARCDFHWIQETGQICLSVQDITAQRRLEQRLQQKEKSALLDSLAGGIAHELNNKLFPVLGFAELLGMRARQQPELARSCEIIRQSVLEAAELVSQLLQLSRPPALEPQLCDLAAIVQAAIGILRFRFRDSGCEPVVTLPAEPVPLLGDPAQLKQVLVNLCLNALDAMPEDAPRRLEVSLTFEESGACLRVRDHGLGIAAEHLPRIFDPFFTTKGVHQGTGLGLSVCFSIIQQHGGTIEVESTGREGTVFALWLPLAASGAATPAIASAVVPAEDSTVAHGRTVLVVDDEEFITSLVHEALRTRLGCRVVRASSSEEALRQLAAFDCHLVISDVRLPGMHGLAFYEEVKQRWPELAERFFFITGDTGSRELNDALAATGRLVLRKPFSIELLVTEVRNLFAGFALPIARAA